MTNARSLVVALVVLTGAATGAAAQTPTSLGQFRDWAAYTYGSGDSKVCYVISQPKDEQPTGVNRDPVYMFVSNRPGEGVHNEVSIITGYTYKDGSRTSVQIGDSSFVMFTEDNGAWVENAADESRLVAAMRAGASMVVKGTSSRDTVTTDTYSLSGVTDSLNAIDQACAS